MYTQTHTHTKRENQIHDKQRTKKIHNKVTVQISLSKKKKRRAPRWSGARKLVAVAGYQKLLTPLQSLFLQGGSTNVTAFLEADKMFVQRTLILLSSAVTN